MISCQLFQPRLPAYISPLRLTVGHWLLLGGFLNVLLDFGIVVHLRGGCGDNGICTAITQLNQLLIFLCFVICCLRPKHEPLPATQHLSDCRMAGSPQKVHSPLATAVASMLS